MKSIALSFLLSIPLFASSAHASCGSEVVSWPIDVNKSCGAQLFANGGAPIGSTELVIDGPNGGEATFKCTEKGWQYQDGNCSIPHNYQCIQDTLLSVDNDIFYSMPPEKINDYLNVVGYGGRQMVVDATNKCDAGN
jgi:hypothetical protein